jgi:hypothetical protein
VSVSVTRQIASHRRRPSASAQERRAAVRARRAQAQEPAGWWRAGRANIHAVIAQQHGGLHRSSFFSQSAVDDQA